MFSLEVLSVIRSGILRLQGTQIEGLGMCLAQPTYLHGTYLLIAESFILVSHEVLDIVLYSTLDIAKVVGIVQTKTILLSFDAH